jgi:hypothetical protein
LEIIEGSIKLIEQYDTQMLDIYHENEFNEISSTAYNSELDGQVSYLAMVRTQIGHFRQIAIKLESVLKQSDTSGMGAPGSVPTSGGHSFSHIRPPPIDIGVFHGYVSENFNTFWNTFHTAVGNNSSLTDVDRLIYLRGFLRNPALKLIQHLSIDGKNYNVAYQLLKNEYFDEELFIDNIIKQMLAINFNVTSYDLLIDSMNSLKAYISELANFGMDFVNERAGSKLLAHIIISKLPRSLNIEFMHKLDNSYPSLAEILENATKILRNMQRSQIHLGLDKVKVIPERSGSYVKTYTQQYKPKRVYHSNFKSDVNNDKQGKLPSSLSSFNSEVSTGVTDGIKPCKFCSGLHRLYKCTDCRTHTERVNKSKELGLCEYCLSNKHDKNTCPGVHNKLSFKCYLCGKSSHISAMCTSVGGTNIGTSNNVCLMTKNHANQQYLLPLTEIVVSCRGKAYRVTCLIDTGSCRSYISKDLATGLNIDLMSAHSQVYEMKTFLGSSSRQLSEVAIGVGLNSKCTYTLPVLIDKELNLDFKITGLGKAVEHIQQSGYPLACPLLPSYKNDKITDIHMLLGVDFIQFIPEFKMINLGQGHAFVLPQGIAPFGNIKLFLTDREIETYFQKIPVESVTSRQNCNQQLILNNIFKPQVSYFDPYALSNSLPDADIGLQHMFSLESLGINNDIPDTEFDQAVSDEFRKNIEYKEGSYYVKLPWRTDLIDQVPSFSNLALKAVHRLVKDLNKRNIYNEYDSYLSDMLSNDMIEEFEVNPKDYNKFNWIPHRVVEKTDISSSTRYRPVWNCSLSVNGSISLNQASYIGLNLLSDLCKMLLYFRFNKYCFLSDIKKAYLQIRLKCHSDKEKLCFFWLKDNKLKTYRFKTLLFGLASSQYILLYVMLYHCEKYPNDRANYVLKNNFYSDNLLFTHNDPQVMVDTYKCCRSRMADANFELTKWNSNLPELNSIFKDEGIRADSTLEYCKVLGYRYNVQRDVMQLSDFLLDINSNTKRKVLSQLGSVYDPLGMCLPLTVSGKLFIRSLWLQNLDWDEIIPDDMMKQWRVIATELNSLKHIEFPRCGIYLNPNEEIVLNIFSDASSNCYAFCIYATSSIGSNLIFAKSKVAPPKNLTIPMLELLALFLAYKSLNYFLKFITTYFQIKEINFFIDSQLVLNWILKKHVQVKRIFTRNRIKDIKDFHSDIKVKYSINISYRYVASEDNPSDLITRGVPYDKFTKCKQFYFNGPTWIIQDKSFWPCYPLKSISNEVKQQMSAQLCCVTVTNDLELANSDMCPILDIYKFSSYNKLIRITALIYKFISKMRNQPNSDYTNAAHQYWIKQVQHSCFSDEIEFLHKYKSQKIPSTVKIPTLIDRLDLFMDQNNFLRSKGRISRCPYFNYDVSNPYLLPKNSYFVKLLIFNTHENCSHLGVGSVLAKLRLKGLWILKARQTIKLVLSTCIICKKFNNLSFKYPKLTNITSVAMQFIKPFAFLGIDFTGHVFLMDENGKSCKYYILVYTCFTIRAIHLDLLPSMSTKHVLLSFKRFCNRYTIPQQLISDNFTSFTQTGQLLQEAMNSDEFGGFLVECNIKHIKIPIRAAWVGSAYEVMVKITKKSLYKVVNRQKLSYFEMYTVLSNIANCINSRPLTYMHSDKDELQFISPNSFLKMWCNSNIIFKNEMDINSMDYLPDHNMLNVTFSKLHEICNEFKIIWKEQYLLSLREQSRSLFQDSWENRMKVGDIVFVSDPKRSRPFWPMARIVKLNIGDDGCIRSVYLAKSAKDVPTLHPISHLYPLEVNVYHPFTSSHTTNGAEIEDLTESPSTSDPNNIDLEDEISDGPSHDIPQTGRPRREAAKKFDRFLKEKLPYL